MSAFVHWVAVTFSCDIEKSDREIAESFAAATELRCTFKKAQSKALSAYYARSGIMLTDAGSMLLHLQRSTRLMIVIPGADCERIKDWDKVKGFFKELSEPRITRLDLAMDIQRGLTLQDISDGYSAGQFSIKGKTPSILHIGNFIRDDGKARTINVGKRQHGKCLRAYEIGRKLKLASLDAIRIEVELKGSKRDIPLDAITSPLPFFCGTYPFLRKFNNGDIDSTDLRERERCATYEQYIEHVRHSYGHLFSLMRAVEPSDKTIIDLLSRPGYPKAFSEEDIQLLIESRKHFAELTRRGESGGELMAVINPNSKIARMVLQHLQEENLSKSQLAFRLGKAKPNRHLDEVVSNLLEQGVIEYTIPSKPNSRYQQYRATPSGLSALDSIWQKPRSMGVTVRSSRDCYS